MQRATLLSLALLGVWLYPGCGSRTEGVAPSLAEDIDTQQPAGPVDSPSGMPPIEPPARPPTMQPMAPMTPQLPEPTWCEQQPNQHTLCEDFDVEPFGDSFESQLLDGAGRVAPNLEHSKSQPRSFLSSLPNNFASSPAPTAQLVRPFSTPSPEVQLSFDIWLEQVSFYGKNYDCPNGVVNFFEIERDGFRIALFLNPAPKIEIGYRTGLLFETSNDASLDTAQFTTASALPMARWVHVDIWVNFSPDGRVKMQLSFDDSLLLDGEEGLSIPSVAAPTFYLGLSRQCPGPAMNAYYDNVLFDL